MELIKKLLPCRHPFSALRVAKEQTSAPIDADFTKVQLHLFCTECNTSLDLPYAKTTHGVKDFLLGPRLS
jgi:hypothetical protein